LVKEAIKYQQLSEQARHVRNVNITKNKVVLLMDVVHCFEENLNQLSRRIDDQGDRSTPANYCQGNTEVGDIL
jgi:hypothetical protein